MKNPVRIATKKDEITITISEQVEHKEVIKILKEKITELKKLYKEEKTPIRIAGKVLMEKEAAEITKIISKEIDVEIIIDDPNSLGLFGIKKVFEKDTATSKTKYYKGGLRSGQKLEFEGSLVILGDVNAGAEIIAAENIVILGELRGLAHSGAKGNKKAILSAIKINCPQIRIANVVKEMEATDMEAEHKHAYIVEDAIVLE